MAWMRPRLWPYHLLNNAGLNAFVDRYVSLGALAAEARIQTLLHQRVDGRISPFPGQIYPTASVTGMPSAV